MEEGPEVGGAGDVVDPEETGPETMDIHITRIIAGNIIQMVLTLAEIMTVQDNMKTRSMKNLQHHSMTSTTADLHHPTIVEDQETDRNILRNHNMKDLQHHSMKSTTADLHPPTLVED